MKAHFIAIGGSVMHNLAIVLKDKGFEITGSDDTIFEPSKSKLKSKGILPEVLGWFPEKITKDIDFVILGMHAHSDNPELIRAKELGLKIYSYPEFLYEHSKNKTRVVISGSHGKTTITAMVLHVLNFHRKNVDYMIGAQLDGLNYMLKLTEENDFIVLEGDEYLSSPEDETPKFLHYFPNITLISGIAWDHINVFKTFDDYVKQFRLLIEKITSGGVLVYNQEDKEVVKLVETSENFLKKLPYQTPDYEIREDKVYLKTDFGDVPLSIFGKHNLSNLEGAKLICHQLGIMDEDFYEAIMSFRGASKRLEKVERKDGGILYKDFAHSPSKVRSTSFAFKEKFKNQKTFGFLELHTYSSLNPLFLNQYKDSLNVLDEGVVFYSEEVLRKKRMQPLLPQVIKDNFNNQKLKIFTNLEDLQNYWDSLDKTKGAFLMMSSGNFCGLDLAN